MEIYINEDVSEEDKESLQHIRLMARQKNQRGHNIKIWDWKLTIN